MVSLKEATEDVAEDVVEDVAEDVAKDVTKDVAKDATDENGNAVLQSLAYANHEMIANLVGAVKELRAENDVMRVRLDALENA